ncbi:hypothetical protein GF407_15895 [candidate division KSB1 bacterium]|nr:hypothetical protein [candidate division KSB1 bacterium]
MRSRKVFTKKKFTSLKKEEFQKWYDDHFEIFSVIKDLLEYDLSGFAEQTGINRLTFYKSRIKSFESCWAKIEKIKEGKIRKISDYFKDKNQTELPLQHFLEDLIGARLVFYFEPDLQWALTYFYTYPVFKVINVKLYSFLKEDFKFPHDTYLRLEKFINKYKATEIQQKQSGYESVHLILAYNYEMLKKNNPILKRIDKIIESEIGKFPFEIQIRTLLQHSWAQSEHTLNYNIKKNLPYAGKDDSLKHGDFFINKFILRSAEHHQNLIWAKHWKRAEAGKISKSNSGECFDRFQFFPEKERKIILDYYHKFINDESSISKFWNDFLTFIQKISKKYALFSAALPKNEKIWGCKRAILLFVGYLGINQHKSESSEELIHTLVKKFIISATDDFYINLISLYEYIRRIDVHLVNADNIIEFCDPLVTYRVAGLHFVDGNARRAIGLIEDAIGERTKLIKKGIDKKMASSEIINKMHLIRRKAEYYWLAFNQDNRSQKDDIEKALKNIEIAFYEEDKPQKTENEKREKRKILSKWIIYLFYKNYLCYEESHLEQFKNSIKGLENVIKDLLDEKMLQSKKNGSLGLQALALYFWQKGDRHKAEDLITLAHKRVKQYSPFPLQKNEVSELFDIITHRTLF